MSDHDEVHEPELYVIKPSDFPGADELRAERDRMAAESRQRYLNHLVNALEDLDPAVLVVDRARSIIDALFVWRRETGDVCHCSCHPHLPSSDMHDYGFACPCMQTPEERRAFWDQWEAERDEFWDSEEGHAIRARRQAEEDELQAWVGADPGVTVGSHGGMCPEQWWGSVDGHSFYFRERHDHWRIELDLRPSGHFRRVWTGGSLDDDSSLELRESEEGDVIAEGVTGAPGYGNSPLERARMIVTTIRDHLLRQTCEVHTTGERQDLEVLFGRPLRWCPECGSRLIA